MTKRTYSLFLVIFLSITVCSAQGKGKDYLIHIKTEYGEMIAILFDETPKHKANFVKLAREHYYDSLLFHRVIDGFMIQGGDPDSKKAEPGKRLGTGGPGYTIDAEILPQYFHERGALSAARLGDQQNPTRASSGSQFYVVDGKVTSLDILKLDEQKLNPLIQKYFQDPANKPVFDSVRAFVMAQDMDGYQKYMAKIRPRIENATGGNAEKTLTSERIKAYTTVGGTPQLDDTYTVFGKVIKGLDVLDKIAAEPKDKADRPLKDIRMTITVEEKSRKKISKEFGYKYPEPKK
jgi:cyclophilin family peptidyl-prolyl cis-trans isomerase